jgi:MFS family permease
VLVSSPVRSAEFRAVTLCALFGGVGFVAENVVLGWLLLDKTGSPFLVGVGIGLRMLPNLLLGMPAGAVADRFDRRPLILALGFASCLVTCMLAFLAFTDSLAVWALMLLTFAGSSLRTLQQAARQSFVFDIVGAERLIGGMALVNLGQRGGGVAGALAVGLVLQYAGAGPAYIFIAAALLLSSAVILLARTPGEAAPISHPAVLSGLRELRFELAHNRTLAMLAVLTAGVEVLGFSHQTLMPSIAKDFLDVGAAGLGLLNAFSSAGGMTAILLVAVRGNLRRRGLAFLVVLNLFGLALILLGNAQALVIALIAAFLVSGLAALSDVLSQSLMQLAVRNEMRGRAAGLWSVAIGLGPIGHLQIGALASALGVATALTFNGAVLLGLAALTLFGLKGVRRL